MTVMVLGTWRTYLKTDVVAPATREADPRRQRRHRLRRFIVSSVLRVPRGESRPHIGRTSADLSHPHLLTLGLINHTRQRGRSKPLAPPRYPSGRARDDQFLADPKEVRVLDVVRVPDRLGRDPVDGPDRRQRLAWQNDVDEQREDGLGRGRRRGRRRARPDARRSGGKGRGRARCDARRCGREPALPDATGVGPRAGSRPETRRALRPHRGGSRPVASPSGELVAMAAAAIMQAASIARRATLRLGAESLRRIRDPTEWPAAAAASAADGADSGSRARVSATGVASPAQKIVARRHRDYRHGHFGAGRFRRRRSDGPS